jgi:hypothetical protein
MAVHTKIVNTAKLQDHYFHRNSRRIRTLTAHISKHRLCNIPPLSTYHFSITILLYPPIPMPMIQWRSSANSRHEAAARAQEVPIVPTS